MDSRQEVLATLEVLDPADLEQVALFVKFLSFRRRARPATVNLDEKHLAAIYGAAATEDRALAEAGLADCHAALLKEDGA